jgi:hypothetical protein
VYRYKESYGLDAALCNDFEGRFGWMESTVKKKSPDEVGKRNAKGRSNEQRLAEDAGRGFWAARQSRLPPGLFPPTTAPQETSGSRYAPVSGCMLAAAPVNLRRVLSVLRSKNATREAEWARVDAYTMQCLQQHSVHGTACAPSGLVEIGKQSTQQKLHEFLLQVQLFFWHLAWYA